MGTGEIEKSPHADFKVFCHDRNAVDCGSPGAECLSRSVRLEDGGENPSRNDDGLSVSSPADNTAAGRRHSRRASAKSSSRIGTDIHPFRSSPASRALTENGPAACLSDEASTHIPAERSHTNRVSSVGARIWRLVLTSLRGQARLPQLIAILGPLGCGQFASAALSAARSGQPRPASSSGALTL